MEDMRYLEQLLDYLTCGKKKKDWATKKLLDKYNCEARTGHLLA